MKRMSSLKNPSPYLAVFPMPVPSALPTGGRLLVVDQLTDPGNLGTLIRLCDWFGIQHIVCSNNTKIIIIQGYTVIYHGFTN